MLQRKMKKDQNYQKQDIPFQGTHHKTQADKMILQYVVVVFYHELQYFISSAVFFYT